MRALILGGGFGGISAAVRLKEILGDEADVTLVDRRTHFFMGFRKIMAIIGQAPLEEGKRPLDALAGHGITVVRGDITSIDPGARAAVVDGVRYEADALLVALGAELAPQAVPGLTEHGINFYDESGVDAAAKIVTGADGIRLAIGIFGAPYKCAPAPYELAILARESAVSRGAKVDVSVFTPQPMSLPVLGRAGCDTFESRLAGNFIDFRPDSKAERVEAGRVILSGGGEIVFDALLAVPPHRCPSVVVDGGLAEAGAYVKVNPRTLETSFDGVYAVGDVVGIKMANDQPFPKAGVMADNEGRVVAERIAARFSGREPDATFDGRGGCVLEVGNGMGVMVQGNFLAEPAPEVEMTPASLEIVADKHEYERSRLEHWFGAGS